MQDSSTCDGADCDGHVYSMWSDEHEEAQNPLLPENEFSADFVVEYETKRLGSKTGDAVFHGCATTVVDLAVGYGNIRTFRLLHSMHNSGLYNNNTWFSNDVDEGPLLEDSEEFCISNSGNHLNDRHREIVCSRAQNDFEYYKDLL